MSESHVKDPGLRADYLPTRLAKLHRRGDIVRKYKEVTAELYDSFVSDIRAGRRRSALIHFRSFMDYCLNCLFIAYPASEDDLERGSLPKNLVRSAQRTIEHWQIPINKADFKRLDSMYSDLSQAAHGARRAVESFKGMREDLIPSTEELAQMMLKWVEEADRRLNSHRVNPTD